MTMRQSPRLLYDILFTGLDKASNQHSRTGTTTPSNRPRKRVNPHFNNHNRSQLTISNWMKRSQMTARGTPPESQNHKNRYHAKHHPDGYLFVNRGDLARHGLPLRYTPNTAGGYARTFH